MFFIAAGSGSNGLFHVFYRTQLRLESLEDTHIIKGEDDALSDKHGCPAYVSPEILNTTGTYSGKAADVWSLGVMLYTLLVGRYPFHDSDPSALFSKIRRGQFCIPDHISPKAAREEQFILLLQGEPEHPTSRSYLLSCQLTARVTRTDAWQYRTLQNLEPKVTDIVHGLSALLSTLIHTHTENSVHLSPSPQWPRLRKSMRNVNYVYWDI